MSEKNITAIEPEKHPIERDGLLCVRVEIKLQTEPPSELSKLRFERVTKRDTLVHAFDFRILDNGHIEFYCGTKVGKSFDQVYGRSLVIQDTIATTFTDFCWMLGEGTTSESEIEVKTPIEGTRGDLTWILPMKMAEDVITMLGLLNDYVLEGCMLDAVLYGPYLFRDHKSNKEQSNE